MPRDELWICNNASVCKARVPSDCPHRKPHIHRDDECDSLCENDDRSTDKACLCIEHNPDWDE